MSLIVAARFKTFDDAQLAATKLFEQGIQQDAVHIFFVNPSGADKRTSTAHSLTSDPVSRHAIYGAVTAAAGGGVVGAVIAVAIAFTFTEADALMAVLGGAGIGAYLGSLGGALVALGRAKTPQQPEPEAALEWASGVTLAVRVDADAEEKVAQILADAGGEAVERAQGRWENGRWVDFDPLTTPQLKRVA